MGVAYAFGLPGGARGVNHVREVVAVQVQARRVARPVVELEQVHRNDADGFDSRQGSEQLALSQQQLGTAILKHVGQAVLRVIGVQRHIGATGLENRQQPDQQLWRTLGGNRDAYIRADAFIAQVVGQPVGLSMQAGNVKAATVPQQRYSARRLQGLLFQ